MESPYVNNDKKFFYLNGIPFLPLSKYRDAVHCRIGISNQLVFIPKIYFNDDLTLKDNVDLNWFLNKKDTKRKIEIYNESLEEK